MKRIVIFSAFIALLSLAGCAGKGQQTICFSYAGSFSCLAGACPDTCCRDWEIDLDEAAKARYAAIPGDLGAELRRAMAEGGDCFRLAGGLCPFLDANGLCRIQRAYGPEALTVNCDSFPRFIEVYGGTEELSLSPACPEAARLLLTAPNLLLQRATDDRPPEPNDLDPLRYLGLRTLRTKMLSLLEQDAPLPDQLGQLLTLGQHAQEALDAGEDEVLRLLEAASAEPLRSVYDNPIFCNYGKLEILRPDWPALLSRPRIGDGDAHCAARYAAYHLFRWLLKATVDGQVLPRVRSAIWGALCLEHLTAAGVPADTALYRYCREIEHNEYNLRAVQSWPL